MVEPRRFRLRNSDALLRSILENAAVATFMVGSNHRLLYANNAFNELLGYDAAESLGLGIDEIVAPEDAAMTREQATDLTEGSGQSYSAERRYRRKNGEPVWVMVRASIMRDETMGGQSLAVIQAVNIDRQKRAEAALAESESRWNFALESAGQGVWDHDLNTGRAFYSRTWRRMRGIGPDEEVDPSPEVWFARMHPDDRERIRAIIERQDSGEIAYNEFEYRERHRDGSWIWILSRGKPVSWKADGTPSRYIGTDTDITSLKHAEREAAREREELKVTLDAIADGVISTDATGRVTFINPAAEQLTGWRTDEANGRPVTDVFSVVDGATGTAMSPPVAECLRSGQVLALGGEPMLVTRNGERCDIRTTASPLRGPQGAIIGAVLVFQDVTDSRARQRELAHTAMHDSLTGLPNRDTFGRALALAAEQARHEAREHALCFVDLDRFKAVNDSAGHHAGDTLLKSIAATIKASCRTIDLVARIGGDEFALLLPDCSRAGALRVAQQVTEAIKALALTWEGKSYHVGASVGIAPITVQCTSPEELMRRADAACYVAKANGRDQVAFYDGETPALQQIARA